MKKALALAGSLVLLGAFSFAEGFSVDGYLRAGFGTTHTTTGSTSSDANILEFQGGNYFSGSDRLRVNIAWKNEDNSCGAFLRYQESGDFNVADSFAYAMGYDSVFDGMLTVAAGTLKNNWSGFSWNSGWSTIDGQSGAAVIVSPLKGLNLVGGLTTKYVNTSDYKAKDIASFGAQYKMDGFYINGGYNLAGLADASVCYSGIKGISLEAEYKYDAYTDSDNPTNNIFEWFDFNIVDNLNFGFIAGQTLYSKTTSTDNTVYVNPYAKYTFNNTFAASLEGMYTMDLTSSSNNAVMVSPAVYLTGPADAEISIWGEYDYTKSSTAYTVGTGVKKTF